MSSSHRYFGLSFHPKSLSLPSFFFLFHPLQYRSLPPNHFLWLALNPSSPHSRLILSVNRLRYAMCAFFPPSPPDRGYHLTEFGASSVPASFFSRQLRDLIICPDERGVVNYVQDQNIMERDITDPSSVSFLLFLFPSLRLSLPRPSPGSVLRRKK